MVKIILLCFSMHLNMGAYQVQINVSVKTRVNHDKKKSSKFTQKITPNFIKYVAQT
jgi:tRNA-dihydrouridine synthase